MDDYPADDAERPRGLLSERDRSYLLGKGGVEPYSQHEREIRADIRERLWNGLLDFALLNQYIERRDLKQLFSALDDDADLDDVERFAAGKNGLINAVALIYDITTDDDIDIGSSFNDVVANGVGLVERERHDPDDDEQTLTIAPPEVSVDVTISAPEQIDFHQLGVRLRTALSPESGMTLNHFSPVELLVIYWTFSTVDDEDTPEVAALVEQWIRDTWNPSEEQRHGLTTQLESVTVAADHVDDDDSDDVDDDADESGQTDD